ncbi:transposase [Apilactobacillus apinorum]|uniref:Insertion element IS150 protein InsJ-like helix-turn-helix domain-containing protein n=1 Tax=Apilactobacillus apinorum TaxID=1218495 RepID=A0ABP9ZG89_9LACO
MFSREIKLAAIKDYYNGLGFTKITKKYGIKGSATLYEWIRKFDQFGPKYFSKNTKTYYEYSFKIKVINWRLRNHESLTNASRHFKLSSPCVVYQWERLVSEGRLNKPKGRPPKMKNDKDMSLEEKNKKLEQQVTYLQAKVAYLEKLDALIQSKKSPTKKKHK